MRESERNTLRKNRDDAAREDDQGPDHIIQRLYNHFLEEYDESNPHRPKCDDSNGDSDPRDSHPEPGHGQRIDKERQPVDKQRKNVTSPSKLSGTGGRKVDSLSACQA
jgi:hypothetical protein